MIRKISQTALLALGLAVVSQPSGAVTITFGTTAGNFTPYVESGFSVDIARIQNGNCNSGGNNASPSCLGLNNNETSTLSKVGGGSFTLNSFWFEFLGNHGVLTVTPFTGVTAGTAVVLTEAVYGSNDQGQVYSTPFTNITSILFAVTDTGNVRIDDVNVVAKDNAPTVTPLPGAVWLLGSVLAGGAGFSRWRKRKAKNAMA